MTCPALEVFAGFALNELAASELERFEVHYFACDVCLRRAQHMQTLVAQLSLALPPVLTPARRRELESRRPELPRVDVHDGERATIHLGQDADVGVWIMHAPLADATRVDLEGRSPQGDVLFSFADVPFDAERGEVALPCQVHYRVFTSRELLVTLTATGADEARVTRYALDHEFYP
jgi:hypothetical protein